MSFTVRRKVTNLIKKHIKISLSGGPFIIDPMTGVNVLNPQLLNERIKHPVFQSRNPKRQKLSKVNCSSFKW